MKRAAPCEAREGESVLRGAESSMPPVGIAPVILPAMELTLRVLALPSTVPPRRLACKAALPGPFGIKPGFPAPVFGLAPKGAISASSLGVRTRPSRRRRTRPLRRDVRVS